MQGGKNAHDADENLLPQSKLSQLYLTRKTKANKLELQHF